jgi:hypothetical protein
MLESWLDGGYEFWGKDPRVRAPFSSHCIKGSHCQQDSSGTAGVDVITWLTFPAVALSPFYPVLSTVAGGAVPTSLG